MLLLVGKQWPNIFLKIINCSKKIAQNYFKNYLIFIKKQKKEKHLLKLYDLSGKND